MTLVHNAHVESITKTKDNFLSAICSLSPITAVILGENKAGGCCSADGFIFCEMLDQAGDLKKKRKKKALRSASVALWIFKQSRPLLYPSYTPLS